MTTKTAKPAPKIFGSLTLVGFNGAKSAEDERVILRKALVKGALPVDRAKAYKIGAIAAILGFECNDVGLGLAEKIFATPAKKRSVPEKKACEAAANRLSRRLKELDAGAADARGKKRGVATGPKTAGEAPKTAAEGDSVIDGASAPASAVPVPLAGMAAPVLVNTAEWDAMALNVAAFLRAAGKRNAKSMDRHSRAFVMAVTAAAENLVAARRNAEEPAH